MSKNTTKAEMIAETYHYELFITENSKSWVYLIINKHTKKKFAGDREKKKEHAVKEGWDRLRTLDKEARKTRERENTV